MRKFIAGIVIITFIASGLVAEGKGYSGRNLVPTLSTGSLEDGGKEGEITRNFKESYGFKVIMGIVDEIFTLNIKTDTAIRGHFRERLSDMSLAVEVFDIDNISRIGGSIFLTRSDADKRTVYLFRKPGDELFVDKVALALSGVDRIEQMEILRRISTIAEFGLLSPAEAEKSGVRQRTSGKMDGVDLISGLLVNPAVEPRFKMAGQGRMVFTLEDGFEVNVDWEIPESFYGGEGKSSLLEKVRDSARGLILKKALYGHTGATDRYSANFFCMALVKSGEDIEVLLDLPETELEERIRTSVLFLAETDSLEMEALDPLEPGFCISQAIEYWRNVVN